MSYRNKGTIGPTVTVSIYPDSSGNWVCDGVADDVQIQAAIDYLVVRGGGTVKLKDGTYNISSTIYLYPYIGLVGELGGRYTNLYLTNGSNCNILEYAATVSNPAFIYVGHITLRGNKTQQTSGHGIYFWNNGGIVMDCMIERVFTMSCKQTGIYFNSTWGSRITHCISEYNESYGFHLQTATEMYIDGCFSSSNDLANYYIQGGVVMEMVNCRADSSTGSYGFYMFEHDRGQFSNLHARNNSSYGIRLQGCTDLEFTSCSVDGNSVNTHGFYLDASAGPTNCAEITFCGCNSYDFSGTGKAFRITSGAEDIIFDGCIAHDAHAGFYSTGTRISIMNGIARDNATYGINIDGVDNLVRNMRLPSNATAPILDGGTDTMLPEIYMEVTDPDNTVGDHPSLVLPDTVDTPFNFQIPIPLEFQQVVTAQVIVTQLATAGPPNMQWSTTTDWGKLCAAENYNAGSDAETDQTTAVTINQLNCIDVSGSLTGIAAGDLVGFTFIRRASQGGDTINADAYYLGFRLRYV